MISKEAPHTCVELISPGAMAKSAGYATRRARGSGDCLLIYTRSGQGYCRARDGEEVKLGPGTVALWELGAWQDYGTDPRVGTWNIIWAHTTPRPHWLPWMSWSERFRGVRIIQLAPVHRTAVDEAMAAALRLARAKLPLADECF